MPLSLDHVKIDAVKNDEALNKQLTNLLKALRPKWNPDSLQFKRYSNGITNAVICVENPEDAEKLVVRIYGSGTDTIIDRKTEMSHFELLSKHDIAPNVHAQFKNGFVCGFLPGDSLNVKSVREEKIVKRICEKLAKMHRIPVKPPQTPFLFSKAQQFLENIPERYEHADKQREYERLFADVRFEEHLEHLKKILDDVKVDTQVLCHNDLLVHNLLYDDESDEVHIIDYEYTAVNYQLFDVANHFCEYAGVEEVNYDLCPDDEEKARFLSVYLTHYFERPPTDDELRTALKEIPKFEAASHLFWTLWALVQANSSEIDFDYVAYAAKRLDQFKRIISSLEHKATEDLSAQVQSDEFGEENEKSSGESSPAPSDSSVPPESGDNVAEADKPFACSQPNCKKRFSNKFLLKKHQFIHTGLRPHSCPFCSKQFNRKDNCLRHKKTHLHNALNQLTGRRRHNMLYVSEEAANLANFPLFRPGALINGLNDAS